MDNYLIELKRQYCMAMGLKSMYRNYDSKRFYKDLSIWLSLREDIGKKYEVFLYYLGKDIDKVETAEVGKGKYDSVALTKNTTIITPYICSNDCNKFLNYSFFPDSKNPSLYRFDENTNTEENIQAPEYIDTYITQNPYSIRDLDGWEELSNGGNYNTIVGIYGHIHDNDKVKKLKQLKSLKDKLISNYILEYECDCDNYYAAIISNGKESKCFVKTR